MEKEILEILKSIQLDIKGLKDEVKDLKISNISFSIYYFSFKCL